MCETNEPTCEQPRSYLLLLRLSRVDLGTCARGSGIRASLWLAWNTSRRACLLRLCEIWGLCGSEGVQHEFL